MRCRRTTRGSPGSRLNYYYFGHYLVALLVRVERRSTRVGLQPRRRALLRARARAVFGGGGDAFARAARGTGAARRSPVSSAWSRWRSRSVLGNLAGATRLLGDLRPLARVRLVVAVAGDRRDGERVSVLQLPARRPARPRDGDAVRARRRRARAAAHARAGRAARQGRLAAAPSCVLAALVARLALRDQHVSTSRLPAPRGGGLRSDLGSRRAAVSTRAVAWCGACRRVRWRSSRRSWLSFSPTTDGIALVREHDPSPASRRDIVLIYALPLWCIAAAFAQRLRLPCRYVVWGGSRRSSFCSSCSPPRGWPACSLVARPRRRRRSRRARRAADPSRSGSSGCSSRVGLGLVAVGDFAYIRDSFDGTSSYRFNTVFKAGYQAWFLLSIAAAVRALLERRWLGRPRRRGRPGSAPDSPAVVLLLAVYPVAGSYSRTDGFSRSPTLGGVRWLERRARRRGGDRLVAGSAVGAPVVLEAAGPDFSPEGQAPGLDVHRAADGDRLGRPRGPVGARPGEPRRRCADDLRHSRPRPGTAPARALPRPLRLRRVARTRSVPESRSGEVRSHRRARIPARRNRRLLSRGMSAPPPAPVNVRSHWRAVPVTRRAADRW